MRPDPTTATCRTCGKRFPVIPSRLTRSRYCSKACRFPRVGILYVCGNCGTDFRRSAANVEPHTFCSPKCYHEGRRNGIALRNLAKRFWAKVKKDGPIPSHVPELGPCWVWIGSPDKHGYGLLFVAFPHRYVPAHRVSYELNVGPIPEGLFVLHRCDNPPCVRPDHLFLGTKSDNSRDMHQKGRAGLPRKRDDKGRFARAS
jgi:hypothetical protein